MTDDEMNALGAKMVRAEIMGDEETANELKAKMESARIARDTAVSKVEDTDKQKVILLTLDNSDP